MTQPRIISDPHDAAASFKYTPEDDWPELILAKVDDVSKRMDLDVRVLGSQSEEIIAVEGWKLAGCKSMREFVETKWLIGWDEYLHIIEGLNHIGYESPVKLKQAEEIGRALKAMEAESQKGMRQGERNDLTSLHSKEVVSESGHDGGNSSSYLLRRMARDHEETFEAYKQGEYPSVRQAAIACGIIKKKTNLEKALAAFNKLNDSERLEFFRIATEDEA